MKQPRIINHTQNSDGNAEQQKAQQVTQVSVVNLARRADVKQTQQTKKV